MSKAIPFAISLVPALRGNVCIRNKGRGTVRDRSALLSAPVIFIFKSPSAFAFSVPRGDFVQSDFSPRLLYLTLDFCLARSEEIYLIVVSKETRRHSLFMLYIVYPIINLHLEVRKRKYVQT